MKQMEVPTFKPRLKVLNREQALAIHGAALEILQKTGFKMEHGGALEMLADAGCRVSDKDRVSMPAKLVEEALTSAPKQFALYDQKGNEVIMLADGNYYYGTGSDATFTIDPDTGERRRAVLKDVGNFARLVDGLENIDFVMSMSNPEDVPVEDIYLHAFTEMVKNTNKPILFIADSGRDIASPKYIKSPVWWPAAKRNCSRSRLFSITRKLSVHSASPKMLWKNSFSALKKRYPYVFPPGLTPGAELRSRSAELWPWGLPRIW